MYNFAIKSLKNRQKLDILKNILLFLLVEILEKVLFFFENYVAKYVPKFHILLTPIVERL